MIMQNSGLTIEEVDRIKEILSHYRHVKKALIYGSRSMGNHKPASDIDIAIVGPKIDLSMLFNIESDLDDLLLPYKFDICIYHRITNTAFLDHIDRVGKEFYDATGMPTFASR